MRSLSAILIALVLASTIQIIPWVEPNPVLEELVKGPPYDGDRYHFTQNDGQWTDGVLFGAHTDFGSVAFSIGSVHYISTDNGGVPTHRYHPIQLSFIGSDGARPSGEEPLDFPTNYIMGRDANCWIFGAKSYRRILYQDLWEGIDLVYFFTSSELKYEFILGPGSDPRDIRIRLDGHSSLSCAGNMLAIGTGGSPCIIDSDLYVHYEDGPDEVLPGSFVMIDESTYSFDVDPPGDRTVIIDPVVSGGYIGGSGTDSISSTVELQDGDIMICGTCDSPGLPIRMNGYDATFNGGADGFIIRKASDDGGIRSATYIGGSHDDHINSMAVSDSGGLYICGLTYSDDFPVTKLAFDDSFNGDTDVFVMGFDSNLLEPTFSTYIGGSGQENSFSISIGKQDRPVVAGNTVSDDFPVVNGSFDTNFSGGSDMFLLMLEKDGSDLIFSSFIGGSGGEIPKDMEISPGGDIYITGLTSSQDFPVSINAMDRTYSGGNDLFVFGLGADGDSMVASTFVGGTGWDDGFGLHIDDDGSILVTGFTRSTDFPGGFDAIPGFDGRFSMGFVLALNGSLSELLFSHPIGGSGNDYLTDLLRDEKGNSIVIGRSYSSDFPTTECSFQEDIRGESDIVLLSISDDGELVYSTFIGGSRSETPRRIELTSGGDLLICGYSDSMDLPITDGSKNRGGYDGFYMLFRIILPPGVPEDLDFDIGNGYIELTWKPPSDVTYGNAEEYLIYRGGQTYDLFPLGSTEGNHFNDTTVENGKTYYYAVRALNSAGLSSFSEILKVVDLESPLIVEDLTDEVAEAGSVMFFRARIWDNVLVNAVNVEYRYGNGVMRDLPMDISVENIWQRSMNLDEVVTTLSYRFIAYDPAGNEGVSELWTMDILDLEPPAIIEDRSDDTAWCGEEFMFDLSAGDNIEVCGINVFYRFGTREGSGLSLEYSGMEGSYTGRITIPVNESGPLYYTFDIMDTSGNVLMTEERDVPVKDGISPWIADISDVSEIGCGVKWIFWIVAIDNIAVGYVNLYYGYTDREGPMTYVELPSGGNRSHTVDVPVEYVGDLNFTVEIADTSGNLFLHQWDIGIVDVIPPSIHPIPDQEIGVGEPFSVEVLAEDNFGITEYIWEGLPFVSEGSRSSGIFERNGSYRVVVKVFDGEGNSNSTSFNVTVNSWRDRSDPPVLVFILIVMIIVAVATAMAIIIKNKGLKNDNHR